jgi:hypothetical protein
VVPKAIDLGAVTGCDKIYGDGIDAGGLTQTGSGYDDGTYSHASLQEGVVLTILSPWDRNQYRFARLWNRNYDDIVAWVDESPNADQYALWKNSADGKGNFTQFPQFTVDMHCTPAGLHFIDMNGASPPVLPL